MENKIIFNNNSEKATIVIREGVAPEIKEPVKVQIDGTINAVKRFLSTREIKPENCHILVNKKNMSIALYVDEKCFFGTRISGSLKLNPEFVNFGINERKEKTPHELAEFIKMNRYFFQSKEVAMNLVSDLMNFKAKIDKEVEDKKDTRANMTQKLHQAVETNIPETFKLSIPIFVGEDAETFEVEVNIDASTLNCTLVSPDVMDIIRSTRDTIIDNEIKAIDEINKALLIINI